MAENIQKIKLLLLYQLLLDETDEDHALTTKEICSYLKEKNVTCDRRTLATDIKMLNQVGYEVFITKRGKQNAYYMDSACFSLPELKILVDAIEAAEFISEKKTNTLIEKVTNLAGRFQSEEILDNRLKSIKSKHSNEKILYSLDAVEKAIQKKKKISFLYFDLDEKVNKIYRKNKERYFTDPLALVQDNDNYYLIAYSEKYHNKTHYRVDKMEQVEILEDCISSASFAEINKLKLYKDRVFSMYAGEQIDITLEFDSSLLGQVFDRFGEQSRIEKVENDKLRIKTPVQISPTFFGWVFQFAGRVRIVKPKEVRQMYLENVRNVLVQEQEK